MLTATEMEEVIKQIRELNTVDKHCSLVPFISSLQSMVTSQEESMAKKTLCLFNLNKTISNLKGKYVKHNNEQQLENNKNTTSTI